MKETTSEGKDVQEAVEKGLQGLGLRRDQVEVAILDEGSPGFLGLGARAARVKLSEKRWEGEAGASGARPERRQRQEPRQPDRRVANRTVAPAAATPQQNRAEPQARPVDVPAAIQTAQAIVGELLALAGIAETKLTVGWDEQQTRVDIQTETPDSKFLIGRDGRGLEALQFVATILVSRKLGSPVAVHLDTEGYAKNREKLILAQAMGSVEQVKRTGRPFRLDPMEPSLRRLIHKALADHPDVETASEGEGPWRKVVLKPRKR